MRRCRYCAKTLDGSRNKRRGRYPEYCSDEHHDRDLAVERNVNAARRRALRRPV
jgi:hypothetical protein